MEGDCVGTCAVSRPNISIHSLRMEGDTAELERLRYICISIHSLRMEGDLPTVQVRRRLPYFNPLPPHGGRL